VGYAPFIIRPRAPSTATAVILPTNTWQAYNFRDMDGDGIGDTCMRTHRFMS
jgi:nitrous oxidase accessory protein NosD